MSCVTLGIAGIALAFAIACAPTETGNPNIVDAGRIDIDEPATGMLRVQGEPRAVSRTDVNLTVMNLDTADPPVLVPVEADGGFIVLIPGAIDDLIRIESTFGTERGTPVDLLSDQVVSPTTAVAPTCLRLGTTEGIDLALGFDIEPVTAGSLVRVPVVIENRCDAAVAVNVVAFRQGESGFSLEGSTVPIALEPGTTDDRLTVRFDAEELGEQSDVLLLTLDDGSVRAISFWVTVDS